MPGAGPDGEPSDVEGLTLRDYLAVMWRRKWVILLVTLVATGAAYIFADRQPDKYEATTDLIYEAQIDVANPLSQYGYTNPTERDLEMRAITNTLASPEMIARAEAILDDTFAGEYASNRPGAGDGQGAGDGAGGSGAGGARGAAETDLPGYSVTSSVPETERNTTGSNVVSITATSTVAPLAAAAANAYARAFVEWRKERQKEQIAKAIAVVQEQMNRYQGDARQSADYLILQQRLRDLQILAGTATGNYRVLVPAREPDAPFEPRPLRSAVLGLGVGLFAGIGLAFLLEQFDTRLRRQDEIARVLRQPVLGRIPRISKQLLGESAVVALRHPDGHVAEAFRVIRTNLDFMGVDGDVRSLLVTSCIQGEGKSVSVANLAVTMALAGKKVVVVDGDLRRPRLHTYFGVDNEVGVSTVTAGKTPLGRALEAVELAPHEGRVTEDFAEWAKSADARSRLYVLPSGPLPPNPGEIVNSQRFGQIIAALEKEADLVLVDSPAMLAVGDTAALAAKVDGLVFLVDMHVVRRPQLLQAAEQLAKLPVRQMGLILRTDGMGGGRYAYYGAPYGYYEYSGRDGGGRGRESREAASGRRNGRRVGRRNGGGAAGTGGAADASGAARAGSTRA